MQRLATHLLPIAAAAILTSLLALPVFASGYRAPAAGTWYLALDAEPFGLPPGVSLPGLMTIHSDGTVLLADGGDFGGFPFMSRDSSQFGAWRYTRKGSLKVVTLFLQADAISGDVSRWQRVQLSLRFADRHTLIGTVNVLGLDCMGPAIAGAFNCPDPIAGAGQFIPNPGEPVDVPVTLRRLKPRFLATP